MCFVFTLFQCAQGYVHGRKSGCKEFADHDRHAGVVCLQNDWLMQGDGNVFSSIDDMEKFLCGLRGDALLKPKSKVRHSAPRPCSRKR
jgi:hypothetical protein